MEWNYPDMSLEDLLKFVKGFADILVLACGYQSTGFPAYWDVESLKRALQWSLFFEKLISNMRSKDEYGSSLMLLETELSLLKAGPEFPRGIADLSVETLSRAKELVVKRLVQMLPLRQEHLVDLLKAVTEVDLDGFQASDSDYIDSYLGELMLQSASYKICSKEKSFLKESVMSSPEISTDRQFRSCCNMDNVAACTIEEILKRQKAVSFMSIAEMGLEAIFTFAQQNTLAKSGSLNVQQKHGPSSSCDEQEVEFSTWSNWRSKSLSYFLDNRTLRLVAGADMIFSVPKCEWEKLFNTLSISKDMNGLQETIELLLLGCVADKWSRLLNHLVLLPYVSCSISKQYSEVHSLLIGPNRIRNAVDQNTKEYSILEYLSETVGNRLHLLCNACPALVAAAIPNWSPLYRLYVTEIDHLFRQPLSSNRFCSCTVDMPHTTCELAERIWCLHSFHMCGSIHVDHPGSSQI